MRGIADNHTLHCRSRVSHRIDSDIEVAVGWGTVVVYNIGGGEENEMTITIYYQFLLLLTSYVDFN